MKKIGYLLMTLGLVVVLLTGYFGVRALVTNHTTTTEDNLLERVQTEDSDAETVYASTTFNDTELIFYKDAAGDQWIMAFKEGVFYEKAGGTTEDVGVAVLTKADRALVIFARNANGKIAKISYTYVENGEKKTQSFACEDGAVIQACDFSANATLGYLVAEDADGNKLCEGTMFS